MPEFTVAPGETITLKVMGVAAAGAPAPAENNFPNAASNNGVGELPGGPNNNHFGGGNRRNRNRKNKTNRRNRKNKTNRRNRKH
jgi:hypothetical protein